MAIRIFFTNILNCFRALRFFEIILGLFLLPCLCFSQVYRWIDDDGVVHFSDKPNDNAELIYLLETPKNQSSKVLPKNQIKPSDSNQNDHNKIQAYDSIRIINPSPEETLWNIEGVLSVELSVVPELFENDMISVFLDGKNVLKTNNLRFSLKNVWRGLHNIQIEIINKSGGVVMRTAPNRFYVQQNRIISPPK